MRTALLMLMIASFAASAQGAEVLQHRQPLVQSVDLQIPSAPLPFKSAGKRHLAYELHVTNTRSYDVVLNRIEILDAIRGSRVAEFSGSQLAARLSRVGAQVEGAERQTVVAGGRTILFLWLTLEDAVATPTRLQHSIELDLLRPTGRVRTLVSDACVVRNEQPIVLNAPLRGGPWVALYDPMMLGGHRTSLYTLDGHARIPARFAIDWVKLADDATRARGDASTVANWHGYGAEVLAVADGTVAEALDDIAESPTLAASEGPLALENVSGNYVALDLGGGRYAFYEHLKPGSITVRRGDRVRSGQVIGLLGNSGGSSSGPHLHFHVADASNELAAEGLPYVFRNFDVVGAYDRIDTFETGQRWNPPSSIAAGKRSMELPGANTVVLFPDAQ
jgi:murein DD-endopeptidase